MKYYYKIMLPDSCLEWNELEYNEIDLSSMDKASELAHNLCELMLCEVLLKEEDKNTEGLHFKNKYY